MVQVFETEDIPFVTEVLLQMYRSEAAPQYGTLSRFEQFVAGCNYKGALASAGFVTKEENGLIILYRIDGFNADTDLLERTFRKIKMKIKRRRKLASARALAATVSASKKE